jgi:hypothetical protein
VSGRGSVRRPLLTGAEASRALDAAERILERGLAFVERKRDVHPGSMDGYCGGVLLADALVHAGRATDDTVRDVLRRALVYTAERPGLHNGAAGLLVTIDAVDPERRSLAAARARLRDLLLAAIREAPAPVVDLFIAYDLISGVAGCAIALRDDEPEAAEALAAYAERLAGALERRRNGTESGAEPVNLGVAHGIPGILAALNAAFPGPHPLARRYVELLLAMSQAVDGAHRWHSGWPVDGVPPARRAWCYHTAGVAAVLYDRARLDRDDGLRELAVASLDAVVHDDRDDDPVMLAALCHGRAGVAAIAWHAAEEGERFERTARALMTSVLDEFDESLPLGYQGFDTGDRDGRNRPGFLDGSFGIALSLVDAVTAAERRWLPLLGLLPD